MPFAPGHDMVDALATDCSDQPLGKTVLPDELSPSQLHNDQTLEQVKADCRDHE